MPDEAYQAAAKVVFEHNSAMLKFYQRIQAEYGKWLVSSLFLVHGAAIGGLVFKSQGATPPPYLQSIWWFVSGMAFAFITGFSAWLNFTFLFERYLNWADYRMLTDSAHWPKEENGCKIDLTRWIAIVFGIISIVCMLMGAWSVAKDWH